MNHTTGPLGCTSSWREEDSGNYTTTIEVKMNGRHSQSQIGFYTSANYKDWSFVGFLNCSICELCVRSCSSFYPAPAAPADSPQLPLPTSRSVSAAANSTISDRSRWVFGVNSGGCKLASVRNYAHKTPTPFVASPVFGSEADRSLVETGSGQTQKEKSPHTHTHTHTHNRGVLRAGWDDHGRFRPREPHLCAR